MDDSCDGIHTTWHNFVDYFKKWYFTLEARWVFSSFGKNKKLKQTTRKYKVFDISQIIGYKAMCKIKRYIKKNSEIREIRCDDYAHAGSNLFLIPHENDKEYWALLFYLFHNVLMSKIHFFYTRII